MRGPLPGVDPLLAPLLYSFQMAREDLALHTAKLSPAELWARPFGLTSAGFHIRHLAGSAERLLAYLQGRELTPAQLAAMEAEASAEQPTREQLLAAMEKVFRDAEAVVRALDTATLADARTVGRKRLPTTVIGLLTHMAEHTQRHVGQAIAAAKLAAALP
ncbi:MAG: DinB family protein [Candidatus Solibacter sp.]